MKKLLMNRKAKTQISAVMIIVMLLVSMGAIAAFVMFEDDIRGVFDQEETPTGSTIIGPDGSTIPTVPSEAIRTGNAKWHIKTVTTQTATASGDTAYVGVAVADSNRRFNPLVYSERTEKDADGSDTSSEFYSAGNELLIAVSSDDDASGCNETYSRWFYIESLDHGSPILSLPKRNPISALTEYTSGGNYLYTVDGSKCEVTGQTVQWYEGGDGSYWQFGTFKLYERLADENTIVQHISAGEVGATYNDGATFEDADSDINANYTFTSDTQSIFLQLVGEESDGAWGIPTLAVTSAGQIKQYQGVIIFATDAVAVVTQPIYDDGWEWMSVPSLTNDVAFYYVVDPFSEGCVPNVGDTLSLSVEISIEDTGLSGEYEFEVWFLDWQNVQDVARGSTSASVPGGNGMCYEVGADAVSQPVALTVTSNSAATPALMGHFTPN